MLKSELNDFSESRDASFHKKLYSYVFRWVEHESEKIFVLKLELENIPIQHQIFQEDA